MPVAAMRVELVPANGKPGVITATDAAGRLDVAGLPAGSYVLTVVAGAVRMGRVAVDVPAGGTAEVGALEWAPTGEVRGVVTGAGGRPVPSAMLIAVASQPNRRMPPAMRWHMLGDRAVSVLTDRQGRFRIPYTTAGLWNLVPWAGNARVDATTRPVEVTVEERKVTTVDLATDR